MSFVATDSKVIVQQFAKTKDGDLWKKKKQKKNSTNLFQLLMKA